MSIFDKNDEVIDVSKVNWETGKPFDLMGWFKENDPEFYQKIIELDDGLNIQRKHDNK